MRKFSCGRSPTGGFRGYLKEGEFLSRDGDFLMGYDKKRKTKVSFNQTIFKIYFPLFSMAASLQSVIPGSLVHRFITSGKPGKCELCPAVVEKLEAHHISYSPEITIKVCHNCHHKIHFWPQRLNDEEKIKILTKRYCARDAQEIIKGKKIGADAFAKLAAPSRKSFILRERQNLENAEAQAQKQVKRKVNKGADLSFLKRIHP